MNCCDEAKAVVFTGMEEGTCISAALNGRSGFMEQEHGHDAAHTDTTYRPVF